MTILNQKHDLEIAATVQTVQARLKAVAAALLGASAGHSVSPTDEMRFLALELRAIAACMDALLPST